MLRQLFFALLFVFIASPAFAQSIQVYVDVSTQHMVVAVDGVEQYNWPVSTGRAGHRTPMGNFRPTWLDVNHHSSKYDNSPMPYSIFFNGGIAIHGTEYVRSLGGAASHGCVRLHPANAAILYSLVQRYGRENTAIHIQG